MGNDNSVPHKQNNCKICMKCNDNNILNTDLMILKRSKTMDDRGELLLRCNKGHILLFNSTLEYIDWCQKKLENKEASEISLLKEEISLLKEEIEILKKINEPSAPPLPLLNVEMVEAKIVK